jgi:hypothetical protein
MRQRTRHVIAVMVVATALCADRSLAATPHVRTAPSRSLASRITTGLRQQVTRTYLVPARTSEKVTSTRLPIAATATGVRSDFSPFQFRLPPPSTR